MSVQNEKYGVVKTFTVHILKFKNMMKLARI